MDMVETVEFEQGKLIKKLIDNLDVKSFVEAMDSNPDLWRENTWRQDYVVEDIRPISPQKDTQAVMFRWAPENTIESVRDSLDIVEHANWKRFPEVQTIVAACMKAAEATELGRVFIAKLKVDGVVIPHCDFGMYSDHYERFHLVLTSDPGNIFCVQDAYGYHEAARMKQGEFFWFNHKEPHWAINNSTTPRMHLIIDMIAPKYRRARASI